MDKIDEKLLEGIAKELGYQVEGIDEYRGYLVGPDQVKIFVRSGWRLNDKYEASGSYPKDDAGGYQKPYNLTSPSIGFDPKRGAKAIAADIQRRLLPDLKKYLAAVLDLNLKSDMNRARRTMVAGNICKAVGLAGNEVRDDGCSMNVNIRYADTLDQCYVGECRIGYEGKNVKMDIDVPADLAIQILGMLKKGGE